MRRTIALVVLIAAGALSIAARDLESPSQQEPKTVKVQLLNPLTNLYMLYGGGGNSLVLERQNGSVLIDPKPAGWGRSILDAVTSFSDKPVTTIINTHSHLGHTGSNGEFPAVTQIVAHERTKATMQRMDAFQGTNSKFLPNSTVVDKLSLFEGAERIDLYYFGPGHTNGDLVVVIPAARLVHLGDLFPSKAAPFIDTANGGSGVAWPETLGKVLSEIHGVSRVSTGHDPGAVPPRSLLGDLMTWRDLEEYADFNREFVDAVRQALKAGKSEAEAAATLKLPEKYRHYDMRRAAANVATIYAELKN
jgi:cyclase